MKFKLFALSMLAATAFVSFSSSVVAKDAASFGESRRGVILIDPFTGDIDESNCNPAPTGLCWYQWN